jgi:hypothetical protein
MASDENETRTKDCKSTVLLKLGVLAGFPWPQQIDEICSNPAGRSRCPYRNWFTPVVILCSPIKGPLAMDFHNPKERR